MESWVDIRRVLRAGAWYMVMGGVERVERVEPVQAWRI